MNLITKISIILSILLSSIICFKNYLAYHAVYSGHFGNGLEYDWAMKPWYKMASIFLLISFVCSILTFWKIWMSYSNVSFKLLLFFLLSAIICIIYIELALPYYYKNIEFLNYGQGG